MPELLNDTFLSGCLLVSFASLCASHYYGSRKDEANFRILPVMGRRLTTTVVVEGVEKGFKAIIE